MLLSKSTPEPLDKHQSTRFNCLAPMLKMLMLSLVSMGIIVGIYAVELFRPMIGIVWIVFLVTATIFLSLSRTMTLVRKEETNEPKKTRTSVRNHRSRCKRSTNSLTNETKLSS